LIGRHSIWSRIKFLPGARTLSSKRNLLDAVEALEASFRRSASLGGENFDAKRKEAVQMRREIADQLAVVSSMGNLAFDGTALQDPFRSEFAKMRSALALHQASWPVVAIQLENPDYLSSVTMLRESTARFMAWVKGSASALA
jgi:hypothetical protein